MEKQITPPEFFHGHIEKAWKLYGLPETNEYLLVQNYLLDVLVAFLHEGRSAAGVSGFLFFELYKHFYAGGRETNTKIKKTGDAALMVASIYDLKKRESWQGVKSDHFIKTASTAYIMLYDRIIRANRQAILFGTLGKDIEKFPPVLVYAMEEGNLYEDCFSLDSLLWHYEIEREGRRGAEVREHKVFDRDIKNMQ